MEQDPDCCAIIINNGFIRHVSKGNEWFLKFSSLKSTLYKIPNIIFYNKYI